MLSVCIPVYNTSVRALAEALNAQVQGLDAGDEVEVLLLDDGSDPAYVDLNAPLAELPAVCFMKQSNAGRSAVRNRLADLAQGTFLLFVDSDCQVPEDFLARYLAVCREGRVVVGGLAYPPRPVDRALLLRWKVGVHREMRSVGARQQQPYHHFLSSNFLIPKALFRQLRFEQNLIGYGHEDTLFGQALRQQQTEILHIDNPVTHLGLDSAVQYLPKVKESVGNLLRIVEQGYEADGFRLWRAHQKLQGAGLARPLAYLFRWMETPLRKALSGPFPSLFLLDFYKLGLLSSAVSKR